MMKKEFSPDNRLLNVIEFVVTHKVNGIEDETHFLKSIGYPYTRNVRFIKEGSQKFKAKHFVEACRIYFVDPNYILRESHHQMFVAEKINDPFLLLKSLLRDVEELVRSNPKATTKVMTINKRKVKPGK